MVVLLHELAKVNQIFRRLEAPLEVYLVKKAPPLPNGVKNVLAEHLWYAAPVGLITVTFGVVFMPAMFGVEFSPVVVSPMAILYLSFFLSLALVCYGGVYQCIHKYSGEFMPDLYIANVEIPGSYILFPAIVIVVSILVPIIVALQCVAIPKLYAKRKQGWNLVFYAAILICAVFIMCLNVAGIIIASVLLYALFQVRERFQEKSGVH